MGTGSTHTLSQRHAQHWLAVTMGDRMGSAKQRPAHVPEDNVYPRMHWTVILTYVVAIGAITLLMQGAS